MAANSVLFDFSIEPTRITDESSRKDIVKVIKENVEKHFEGIKIIYDTLLDDGYLCLLGDNKGVVISLRFFNEGLITLNIEYFRKEGAEQRISFEVRANFFFFLFSPSHPTFCNVLCSPMTSHLARSLQEVISSLFTISNYMLGCLPVTNRESILTVCCCS